MSINMEQRHAREHAGIHPHRVDDRRGDHCDHFFDRFKRRDEVEAAWSWVEPILAGWENSAEKPKSYTAGTWGPSAAIALIERDGRTWHDDNE